MGLRLLWGSQWMGMVLRLSWGSPWMIMGLRSLWGYQCMSVGSTAVWGPREAEQAEQPRGLSGWGSKLGNYVKVRLALKILS